MLQTDLSAFLRPDHTLVDLRALDKRHLLAELARRAGLALKIAPEPVETALLNRERLGSTGLGSGFALPHARLADLGSFFGLFARLGRAIDFEAIDGQPVDLVFLLLIPDTASGGHVSALAAISRRLRDPTVRDRLRRVPDASAAYAILLAS